MECPNDIAGHSILLLIILLFRLEICLRVLASRALTRSIFCLADETAVATLPPDGVVTMEEVAVG